MAEARQQLAAKRLQSYYRMHVNSKQFTHTIVCVCKMQTTFRLYLLRLNFLRKLKQFRYERDQRLRDIAERRRQRSVALLYRECINIDGTLNIITCYRHSKRDVYVIVYNPGTCEKFTFTVLRTELVHMLETARGEGPIPDHELFLKKNMRLLANQLMYKKR